MIARILLFCTMLGVTGCEKFMNCPLSYAQQVVGYVTADKVPLRSQSDCSGAARVLNEQGLPGAGLPGAGATGRVCYADPTDSTCMSCLEGQCCGQIDHACGADGGASSLACAADVGVRQCFAGALAGACVAPCAGGTGGSGGSAAAGGTGGAP